MLHHLIFTFKEWVPSLYHITAFHFYLFLIFYLSPHFVYSFPQDVLFPVLYYIMCLFIRISFCLCIFNYLSMCNIFCIFFLCLHVSILSWFFSFIMTFPPLLWLLKILLFTFAYAFLFIYHLSFHILLVLLLTECAPSCSTVGFVGIAHILLFHLNLPASHYVSLSASHYVSIFTCHHRSGFHISKLVFMPSLSQWFRVANHSEVVILPLCISV